MKGSKGSKNNAANRGTAAALRKLNGKEVVPVRYVGTQHGHGTYIAAAFKEGGGLAKDSTGKPIPYGKI